MTALSRRRPLAAPAAALRPALTPFRSIDRPRQGTAFRPQVPVSTCYKVGSIECTSINDCAVRFRCPSS